MLKLELLPSKKILELYATTKNHEIKTENYFSDKGYSISIKISFLRIKAGQKGGL